MWIVVGIVCGIVLLWKGADWVVENAAVLAQRLGLSELVIGMTVVALGTSAPELVVSLVAAFDGHPDVSVANVVGSNICNTGLILGLCAALYCMPTSRTTVHRDVPVLLGSSVLLLMFLVDRRLGPLEGAALLMLLGVYLLHMILVDRNAPADAAASELPDDGSTPTWRLSVMLVLGLAAVLGGARLLVDSATTAAEQAGFSDWVIGVTVVAGGTSLPELATAVVAARRAHAGLVIGNLVGSDIFNVLGVLGFTSSVHVLEVGPSAVQGLVVMVAFLSILLICMRSGWRLSRSEGVLLVALALWRWSRDVLPDFF